VLVAVAAGGEGDDTSHVLLGDGVWIWTTMDWRQEARGEINQEIWWWWTDAMGFGVGEWKREGMRKVSHVRHMKQ
jgi:hypothetical protein